MENGCKENRIKRKYQQLKCYKTADCGICVSLHAKSLLILQYQIFVLILSPGWSPETKKALKFCPFLSLGILGGQKLNSND